MFCKNCGSSIPEGAKFCAKCGTEVAEVTAVAEASKEVTATPAPQESAETKKKGSSKKKGILISAISLGVLAIVTAAVVIVLGIFNDNNSVSTSGGRDDDDEEIEEEEEKKENSYVQEIKDYLDYLAEENEDAMDLLTDTYFCGGFGEMYSGKDADEINEIILENMFEQVSSMGSSGYYYGYNDLSSYDTWQEYLEDGEIEDLYDDMKSTYGRGWSLEYKIGDAKELSESKLKRLQNSFEDELVDYYDGIIADIDSKKDREKVEEFVEFLEELEIEEAYKVEVEITIEGKKDDYDGEVEFVVAKIGKQWVIMEGPSYYDFIYP